MTTSESGNVPQVKISRWANAKFYACEHPDVECEKEAIVVRNGETLAHNCCAQHGAEWELE